ncbi:mannose-6-phosphate isomerase, class I [Spirochaetia bacterium]|nr:mannose-6-phosphate isomerase, class I [Spirochaetia bacterium]
MPKSNLRIDILGTSLSIAAEEDSAYLESLLNHYRIKIENNRKKFGLSDPLKLAIVTGFLLCDEAQKAQHGGTGALTGSESSDLDEAERLTLDLITRIDEVLENGNKLSIFQQGGALKHLLKLENTVKHYDWGSPRWIPQLLGRDNAVGEPWAELWMGVHPEGPSLAIVDENPEDQISETTVSLEELIRQNPKFYLGEQVQKEFSGLPFLYKLLAAGKPLSVQAHPNLEQAQEGWERENSMGISLKAPDRNYKDANHKPEILCALSPFRAMCGFREPGEIKRLLDIFSGVQSGGIAFGGAPRSAGSTGTQNTAPVTETLAAGFARLRAALDGDNGLRDFLTALFALDEETRFDLGEYTAVRGPELERFYPGYADEWRTAAYFASLYPGDPAVIAPLYLNLLRLTPGEAVYLPAGVLHAYIEGFGVELMANSDNVLRGGLTAKHVDIEELTRILKFTPFRPEILRPQESGKEGTGREPIWSYPTDCREFSLGVTQSRGEDIPFPAGGPEILLVTQGKARLSWRGSEEEVTLEPGESAFAAQREQAGDLVCSGSFTIFAASVGSLA